MPQRLQGDVSEVWCCCVLLSPLPQHSLPGCSCSPAFKDALPPNSHRCYWIHSSVTCLGLGSSPELPLPNVSWEVSASTEAGQSPLSTTSGNPSTIRMLNLWPLSNLVYPPLPTIHYQCLHSCRCVLLSQMQSFQVPTGVMFLNPYNFPLCLC